MIHQLKYVFIVILLLSIQFSFAEQGSNERTIDVITQAKNTSDIFKEAEMTLTNELIQELIGLENYEKIQSSLEKKIYPNTKKFILLTKSLESMPYVEPLVEDESEESAEGTAPSTKNVTEEAQEGTSPSTKNVTEEAQEAQPEESGELAESEIEEDPTLLHKILIRFSKKSLKDILISENLFYAEQSANRILSLIEFKDNRTEERHSWWKSFRNGFKDPSMLKRIHRFYSTLQAQFLSYGFYIAHPIVSQYSYLLPKKWAYSDITPKKAKDLAQFFDAQIILIGSVTLSPYSRLSHKVSWNLSAYHVSNLRSLAQFQVSRKWNKDDWSFLDTLTSDVANSTAKQLNVLYQRGIISSQLFTIELRNIHAFKKRQLIKKTLIQKLNSIKDLTEAFITSESVQYSANVDTNATVLLKRIQELQIPDFSYTAYLKLDNHIVIRFNN